MMTADVEKLKEDLIMRIEIYLRESLRFEIRPSQMDDLIEDIKMLGNLSLNNITNETN